MIAATSNNTYMQEAVQLLKTGLDRESIKKHFKEKGVEEPLINDMDTQLLLIQRNKWRTQGFIWVGIGFFLLSFGFILTLMLFEAGMNFNIAMYTLTLLGIGCTLKGIVNIMGW